MGWRWQREDYFRYSHLTSLLTLVLASFLQHPSLWIRLWVPQQTPQGSSCISKSLSDLRVQSPEGVPMQGSSPSMGVPSGHMEWLPRASIDVPFPQTKGLVLFLWCLQTSWNRLTACKSSFQSQRVQHDLFPHLVGECEGPVRTVGIWISEATVLLPWAGVSHEIAGLQSSEGLTRAGMVCFQDGSSHGCWLEASVSYHEDLSVRLLECLPDMISFPCYKIKEKKSKKEATMLFKTQSCTIISSIF